MKQQQLQARLQQAQLLRRRMAVMNTRGGGSTVMPAAVSPGAQQAVVMPTLPTPGPPHQPGIGLKPGTQTPPANVLQVVKQVHFRLLNISCWVFNNICTPPQNVIYLFFCPITEPC